MKTVFVLVISGSRSGENVEGFEPHCHVVSVAERRVNVSPLLFVACFFFLWPKNPDSTRERLALSLVTKLFHMRDVSECET